MKRQEVLPYILVILGMSFWAFSFIWFKMANEYFRPITIILLRLILSSFILFLITRLTRNLQNIKPADRIKVLWLTLFNPFLYFIGESYGLTFVSSSIGSVIISLIPLVTPFAAHYFLNERLSLMNWIGVFISVGGVIIIVTLNQGGEAKLAGILLLLFAVFCAVAYTILLKKLSVRYNALTLVTWQNLIGAALFVPLFLLLDLPKMDVSAFQVKSLIPVIELAFFASTLAFVFYTIGIKQIGATRTSIFANITPVITAVFGYILLDEALGWIKITGILVVITGLFLAQVNNQSLAHIFPSLSSKLNRR